MLMTIAEIQTNGEMVIVSMLGISRGPCISQFAGHHGPSSQLAITRSPSSQSSVHLSLLPGSQISLLASSKTCLKWPSSPYRTKTHSLFVVLPVYPPQNSAQEMGIQSNFSEAF